MYFSTTDLTIPGKTFGDDDDTCYLPIFAADTPGGQWLLGDIALQRYYTVLDLTPAAERNEDFI